MAKYSGTAVTPSMAIRKLLKIAASLALFSLLASLSASAQSARGNSGQAVLHIRINIVPVLMAPPSVEPSRPLTTAIAYNIPTSKSNVEMIEESRPLSASAFGRAVGPEKAVLRTLTIVPR
jgi:hypothetical protein